MKHLPYITILLIILLSSCSRPSLKNGMWRATVKTETGVEIPFNFSLTDSPQGSAKAGRKQLYIINGDERFKIDSIKIENDSIYIQIPLFDCEIRAKIGNSKLSGRSVKHLADKDIIMEFNAEHDIPWRFLKTPDRPDYNIDGRWSAVFVSPDGKSTAVIGEFKQNGSKLKGTFLSATGDYRFLEGTISDDKLFLSSFSGSDVYLFTGTLKNDSTIINGKFYSGYSSVKDWTASKDEKAMLPDAYSLTGLKPGYKNINFSFPDLNRKIVSLSDAKFKDKVIIVQFLGSWCANCMDETIYLTSFYQKYKSRGVEIVGLAYERTKDFERSKKNVQGLKERLNVNYDLLITGYVNDNAEVIKSIPMLNEFMAFPTTIIIDKKGAVHKIHTGFSGPGTGKHYTEFINEFENSINNLLSEN